MAELQLWFTTGPAILTRNPSLLPARTENHSANGSAADNRAFPLLRKPFVQSDLQRVITEDDGALLTPTDTTMRILGNGQRRFPMHFCWRRHVCEKGLVPGMLKSTSRETLRPVRPKNGVGKSTKRFFLAAISRGSFSSIRLHGTTTLTANIPSTRKQMRCGITKISRR
jgi:hypothetical protein